MSLISTVANYGGKLPSNTQNIKQFVVSPTVSQADWVFSKISKTTNEIYITPASKNKSVYIYTDLYVNGAIYNTSDKNHKEQIEPISESKIEKLFDLEPVEYKLKGDIKNKKHFGLIAQDVENIYPELVTNIDSGFKNVNYMELIPMLLLKMKTMQKEIDELKEQIGATKKDI
jgi:alpha-mannosidase